MTENILSKRFILLIFIFGLFLKVLLVYSVPLFHDMGGYISQTLLHDDAYMNLVTSQHPPFGYYFHSFFLTVFGMHDYIVRLISFSFSLLEMYLIYIISMRWFGIKTAQYTLILYSLTYVATLNALSTEVDGAILSLLSILLFYSIYEYYRKNRSSLLLSAVFMGFSILVKVRAILFLVPITIFSYYKTGSIMKTTKDIVLLGVGAFILFLIFPVLVFLANPEEAIPLLMRVVDHNVDYSSLLYKVTHPLLFLQVVIVYSFLFFPFLFCMGVWSKNKKDYHKNYEKILFLFLWFSTLFSIILLVIPEGLATVYPRYLSFLLPPLIILSARGMDALNLPKKYLYCAFIAGTLLGVLLLYANQSMAQYWYFITIILGIIKIGILLIILIFLCNIILVACYFLSKNRRAKQIVLTCFLTINIAFNLLLISDPLIDQTQRKIMDSFVEYYQDNEIKEPIFVWSEDVSFYLGIKGMNVNRITDPLLKKYAEKIGYDEEGYYFPYLDNEVDSKVLIEQGGTVFSMYYPIKYTIDVEGERRKEYEYLIANCVTKQQVLFKHGAGYIFEC